MLNQQPKTHPSAAKVVDLYAPEHTEDFCSIIQHIAFWLHADSKTNDNHDEDDANIVLLVVSSE